MNGADPIFYWDSCLFLAWIKDEERKSGEMDGVREVIARHRKREVKIITSTLTSVEVLQSKLPVGLERLIGDLMKRIVRIGVDSKVASMAHDIRDYYARNASQTISTPDAIHLATAILYRVTEFHTFDDGKSSSKSLGLLSLSGNVGGHRLTICKPQARNPQLDLRKPSKGPPN
ncbi:MAG: PIN domain-containing protein [Roseomonas sp.]|jgi:predicted nucleic acid-binding protein|nr:PIN domain-containing protein [Roseomonas sp.]MCA3313755.1 PIN domain-containing protein [Roseomonas sp.]MCA3320738.1 PIN domain-containing protein [Roseomonas sp.]MCA3345118.1 PIN domain-containing protein [Roseomonas sp.]